MNLFHVFFAWETLSWGRTPGEIKQPVYSDTFFLPFPVFPLLRLPLWYCDMLDGIPQNSVVFIVLYYFSLIFFRLVDLCWCILKFTDFFLLVGQSLYCVFFSQYRIFQFLEFLFVSFQSNLYIFIYILYLGTLCFYISLWLVRHNFPWLFGCI